MRPNDSLDQDDNQNNFIIAEFCNKPNIISGLFCTVFTGAGLALFPLAMTVKDNSDDSLKDQTRVISMLLGAAILLVAACYLMGRCKRTTDRKAEESLLPLDEENRIDTDNDRVIKGFYSLLSGTLGLYLLFPLGIQLLNTRENLGTQLVTVAGNISTQCALPEMSCDIQGSERELVLFACDSTDACENLCNLFYSLCDGFSSNFDHTIVTFSAAAMFFMMAGYFLAKACVSSNRAASDVKSNEYRFLTGSALPSRLMQEELLHPEPCLIL